jgi:hypothetical protein
MAAPAPAAADDADMKKGAWWRDERCSAREDAAVNETWNELKCWQMQQSE